MRLVVGKKYKWSGQSRTPNIVYTCVFAGDQWAILQSPTREESVSVLNQLDYYVEYKEPVVHKRNLIWFLNGSGTVCCVTLDIGFNLSSAYKELKRETVEYTENFDG